MKIKIKGIAIYEAEIDDKLIVPGFDLEKWAREEIGRQVENFMPDDVEYCGYEIEK